MGLGFQSRNHPSRIPFKQHNQKLFSSMGCNPGWQIAKIPQVLGHDDRSICPDSYCGDMSVFDLIPHLANQAFVSGYHGFRKHRLHLADQPVRMCRGDYMLTDEIPAGFMEDFFAPVDLKVIPRGCSQQGIARQEREQDIGIQNGPYG